MSPATEPRNLVVCCDGTGNIWGNDRDTNFVKLTRLLINDHRQILFYDPGVGTNDTYPSIGYWSRFRTRAKELMALADGGGIYENIGQAYQFLVEHYEPGDRLFFFGFSRGAFAARCVAGMVNLFGIVRPGTEAMIPTLTRIYFEPTHVQGRTGKTRNQYGDDIREVFALDGRDARIYFLGVWDTVSTVGGLSKQGITSSATVTGKRYDHVRHAVSLQEYRHTYIPRLFEDKDVYFDQGDKSLKQVWFAGVHSDVGGSYQQHGLSDCSLKWMVEEAMAKGLRCDPVRVQGVHPDPLGLAHDEVFSHPTWALSGLQTRLVPDGAVRHESVMVREQAEEQARQPERVWRPLRKNPRALGCIIGAIGLCVVVFKLGQWACLKQGCGECSGEFNSHILSALFKGTPIEEVWGSADGARLWLRYIVDYIFIGVYASALCWLVIYARRALADRSRSVMVHTVAYWAGLVPLWMLIASDVLENALTLFLVRKPSGTRASYVVTTWLLAGFTMMKLLACIVIACLLGWLALYLLTHRKQDLLHARP
ncbi:MAG: DUF2235 domain-containing protein [Nitrospiraceae bacterium]